MRYTWIVLGVLGVLGQGCARAPAPQAEVPTMQASADEEQLDALVIDQRPMVAEVGECPFGKKHCASRNF